MIKRTLLAFVTLTSCFAAAFLLYTLDQIVHGTLYNYGLLFSHTWADPYWFLLRTILVLLAVNVITTIASLALSLRAIMRAEKWYTKPQPIPRVTRQIPTATRNAEKPRPMPITSQQLPTSATTVSRQQPTQQPVSQSTPAPHLSATPTQTPPSSSPKPTQSAGLVKCPTCNKSFTQPLRMLDFQGQNPRIIDTCPFCGGTVRRAIGAQGREQSQDDKLLTKGQPYPTEDNPALNS